MCTLALLPKETKVKSIKIGTRKERKGGYSINVQYKENNLRIQTPYLTNVFGTQTYSNPGTDNKSYSLSWRLGENEEEFSEFMINVDKHIRKLCGAIEDIEYFSPIRPSKNNKYAPTLRTKIREYRGKFDCKFVNEEEEEEGVYMEHGQSARLILDLMPIWKAGSRIGSSWRIVAMEKAKDVLTFRD